MDRFKIRLETYKIAERKYQEESASMDKLMVLLQNTVSSHLMKTCCRPGESFRTWITALKDTVGIDDEEERERARDRYLAALKPMKQPSNWDTWLIEYDHAASTAETEKVAEVQNIQDVMRDFLRAILKAAPTWEVTFKENGRREKGMTRRQMMKRFREHMSDHYPAKGKQQRAAFAASGVSFPADGGESTQGTQRDASRAADNASSASTTQGGRGRPCNKRNIGQTTTSKQSSTGDTAAAGGKDCPACGQRHRLDKCYYVYKDKAPEWFVPRSGITMMVSWRLEHDADLQELIRGEKRSRANEKNTTSASAK